MAKVYAVKKGYVTGIFNTWSECETNVKGYPGAKYKSFANMKDAKAYLTGIDSKTITDGINDGTIRAYVDGSFNGENYGYGYVIVRNNEVLYKEGGAGSNTEACSIRNVAGELTATMRAVKYCHDHKIKCYIYHDYVGIASWYNGEWKTKSALSKAYVEYMKKYNDTILGFVKVKGHSGDKYNDMADKLASCSI